MYSEDRLAADYENFQKRIWAMYAELDRRCQFWQGVALLLTSLHLVNIAIILWQL